jgi:hypothetical protein
VKLRKALQRCGAFLRFGGKIRRPFAFLKISPPEAQLSSWSKIDWRLWGRSGHFDKSIQRLQMVETDPITFYLVIKITVACLLVN